MRRTSARIALGGVILGLLLGLGAAPASAHNVSGVGATNYETTLEGIAPETAGITARVVEGGSRLQLTNTNDRDVVVLGYEDEPYLRIGPDGVFENQRSPATYLNRDRTGSQTGPATVDAGAEPEWKKTSSGQTARWHDHRIHWMGAAVDRPDERFVVEDRWIVPLRFSGDRLEITGQLVWVPASSPLPWYALAGALVALGALVGLSRRWGRGLAVLVAILIGLDVAHTLGIVGATAGGPDLMAVGPELLYSIVAWGVGLAAISLLWRGKRDGCFAALFAGVLLAVFGGLSDISVLDHSQVPFAWSAATARVLVASTLGLGLGVAVGSVLSLWRQGAFGARPSNAGTPVPSEP